MATVGEKFKHIKELERLQYMVDEYEERFSKELQEERQESFAAHAHEVIPPMLNIISIWCRNSLVCEQATHCSLLQCAFKDDPNDVINGISKCHTFQITTKSDYWGPARHLADPGSIDLRVFRQGSQEEQKELRQELANLCT